jgi:hypothetical protein
LLKSDIFEQPIKAGVSGETELDIDIAIASLSEDEARGLEGLL